MTDMTHRPDRDGHNLPASTPTTSTAYPALNPAVLEQAAEWLLLSSDDWDQPAKQAFQRWLGQHQDHQRAWQRALHLQSMLGNLPEQSAQILQANPTLSRRRAMSTLVMMMTTGGLLAWQSGVLNSHDFTTRTSEQLDVTLADGTRLQLNTNTQVDVSLSSSRRQIQLQQGEILINTGKNGLYLEAPFHVSTRDAQLQALGTRFSVQQQQHQTRLQVFEGRVRVSGHQGQEWQIVTAGQQVQFNQLGIRHQQAASISSTLWTQQLFAADNLPLAELVTELQRYFSGHIRLHPTLANQRVSGLFPINNIPDTLSLLAQSHPLEVSNLFGVWLTIQPRL